MTIAATPIQTLRQQRRPGFCEFHLTKPTRDCAKVGAMQSRSNDDQQNAASEAAPETASASELRILRDIFRMLPSGVTLQDEQGQLLLINDAAEAQLGISATEPSAAPSKEWAQRRTAAIELLRSGRASVAEESVNRGEFAQTFLTTHRPVRIADRNLLL